MTVSAPHPGTVAAAIEARLSDLGEGDGRIAQIMLALGPDLIYHSVSDISERAGSSLSSVVRCCQRLGFKGFQDLKIALSRDPAHPTHNLVEDASTDHSPMQIVGRVAASAQEAVAQVAASIDPDALDVAVDLLDAAGRILLVGVGTSAPLVQDAGYRLSTIGLRAEAPADVHVQHVKARLLTAGDVCLAVSHTGATRETLSAVAAARAAGARVVAVSSFVKSPLIDLVDVGLVAASRETLYRVEAMASRIAHLVILDSLYVAVALRRENTATAALEAATDALADHRY